MDAPNLILSLSVFDSIDPDHDHVLAYLPKAIVHLHSTENHIVKVRSLLDTGSACSPSLSLKGQLYRDNLWTQGALVK